MIKKSRNHYRLISVIPRMILILAFLVPLFFSLSKAFLPEGEFTFSLVKEAFTSQYNLRLLSFTVKESLYSAILSVLIALPGAYLYSNYTFRGKKFILSLAQLCFVLPSILVVLGFVIFYGNNGFLNRMLMSLLKSDEPVVKILYSFRAIILAHAFLNFPVALSLLTGYWSSLSRTAENAAATLGAGKLRIFLTITLSRILPVLLSAALLIFLYCFTSFSIILVLGGGPEYTTLEVEIYRTNNIMGQSAKASALALYALFFNTILVIIYTLLSKHTRPDEKSGQDRAVSPGVLARTVMVIYTIALLIFILGPLVSIPARSVWSTSSRYGSGFTLRAYEELFGLRSTVSGLKDAKTALMNSVIIAGVSALLSTFLALRLALYITRVRSTLGEVTGMLPMMISSVTLALGFSFLRAKLPFRGMMSSLVFIFLAHFVIVLPFALRTILPVTRSIDERILYAAYTLGAREGKASATVEKPLLRSTLMRAFSFSFALSMGEMNATMTLSEGRITTLPLLLYRLINSYNYQGACAVGTVLIVTTLLIFLFAELLGGRRWKN